MKLPKKDIADRLKLTDEVAMEYYRLQKATDGSIVMEPGSQYALPGIIETGMKRDKDERAPLSEIITLLNDRFNADFTEADRLFFEQIEQELKDDEKFVFQAKNNSIENLRYRFNELFDEKAIDRMEQNQDIFTKLFNDKEFGSVVREFYLKKLFSELNKAG